jgi:hypothetical protein
MKTLTRGILALMVCSFLPAVRGDAGLDTGLILTVGRGGTYASIQAAIDTALTSLDSSPIEIRVGEGAYYESVSVPAAMNQGRIILSGGWNVDFASRSTDPLLTQVDGSGQGRVFDLKPSGGALTIEGLSIVNGRGQGTGGGLLIEPVGDATVTVANSLVEANMALGEGAGHAAGAGIFAYLRGTTRLFVTDCVIRNNRCDGGSSNPAVGGGLVIYVNENALFTVRNNRIEHNSTVASGNQSTGAGVYLYASEAGSGEFSDNHVSGNEPDPGPAVGAAAAMWMNSNAFGRITARRNAWVDNVMNAEGEDVSLISSNTGAILFTDSVVAGAKKVGLACDARDSSAIYLNNLTIADNQHMGVYFRPDTGTTCMYNSILYDNAVSTSLNGVDAGNNLIDVDPKVVNVAARDFRLLPTSPAIDVGANNPPGGLGPMDMDGHERITSGVVDIGAYELREADFGLSFDQPTVSAARGTKVIVRVNIDRSEGYTGPVTVTPPSTSAIGVRVKPRGPRTTSGDSLTFKLKIKAGATVGEHQLPFIGRDNTGHEHTAMLTVVVH